MVMNGMIQCCHSSIDMHICCHNNLQTRIEQKGGKKTGDFRRRATGEWLTFWMSGVFGRSDEMKALHLPGFDCGAVAEYSSTESDDGGTRILISAMLTRPPTR